MWHEARRQERKIRGMLVDYRRRAERRRDFYEKIKADPTQFLQIHGRQSKIHLDPAIAAAADSASAMMPWQGQADNLIDRFDVRAHLDYIPPVKKEEDEELTFEERQINYERYRIIAQNSFLAITEEKFLKQLHLEEQFGYTETKIKKERGTGGVAIGFNYEDGTAQSLENVDIEDSDGNSDSDLDVDLSINVSKMDSFQAHEMNRHGRNFGMSSNDFYSFLTNDLEEAESFRQAKEEEHEKALFSGRKSRRERRAHREKRLANRVISPPSYAARISPIHPSFRQSKSPSKSPSPEISGKITYITSFGDEEETPSTSKPTYADKVKQNNSKRTVKKQSCERTVYISRKRTHSRSRSRSCRRSYSHHRKRRDSPSKSRRRSWSRDHYKKSRSQSKSRHYRRRFTPSPTPISSSSSSSSSTSYSASTSRTSSKSSRSSSYKRSNNNYNNNNNNNNNNSNNSKNHTIVNKISSPVKSKSKSPPRISPPKVVSRYYGRKKSDKSSSDLSDNDTNEVMSASSPANNNDKGSGLGNINSGNAIKKIGGSNLSIQERLKRKRQALLNKQFKADKIAEQLKTEREKQEQQNREDELREMAIKLRRKQREKRQIYESTDTSDTDSTLSKNSSGKLRRSLSPQQKKQHSKEMINRLQCGGKEERSPQTSSRRYVEKRSVYRERDRERDRNRERDRERDRERERERDRDRREVIREHYDKDNNNKRSQRLVDY